MAAICEPINGYVSFSRQLIAEAILKYSLEITEQDNSAMGERHVIFENSEFIVSVSQDRIGFASVELGSKLKRASKMQKRGTWSMGHLRGYMDGFSNHYVFENIKDEGRWFLEQETKLFDSTFLNSDDLNNWAIKASR